MKRFVFCVIVALSFTWASSFSEGIQAFKQQNYKEALELLKEAYYDDDAINAGYFLGKIYLNGLGGIKPDINMAETFLKAAADSGNVRAQCLMAQVYAEKYHNLAKAEKIIKENSVPDCKEVAKKLQELKKNKNNK
ncbi:sel1 repeat family protein [Nitratiruptor sp. SB155-2]|uniref:sel1 repeat family protein n=1 Tax=Nitratiruptor sp. (strain SB155-2) TaxID=387092 RepID=UPI000158735C|nr:sel1 repeat family protein [Nitratiruptor sp. SB155-2]BAF70453.1 hypothetical protein NIS_1345 [Nitratiruptor sp. SB155-2]